MRSFVTTAVLFTLTSARADDPPTPRQEYETRAKTLLEMTDKLADARDGDDPLRVLARRQLAAYGREYRQLGGADRDRTHTTEVLDCCRKLVDAAEALAADRAERLQLLEAATRGLQAYHKWAAALAETGRRGVLEREQAEYAALDMEVRWVKARRGQ